MPRAGKVFCQTTWGSADSAKRALLLHAGADVGLTWYKVAADLVGAGYRVDAPDLMGMGFAPLSDSGSYTLTDHAEYILSHIDQSRGYDLVCGASIGAAVTVYLLPMLRAPPARVVLIEPALDQDQSGPKSEEEKAGQAMFLEALKEGQTPSEEALKQWTPHYDPEELVLKRLGMMCADGKSFEWMFAHAGEVELSHALLAPLVKQSEIIILCGDPQLGGMYPVSNAEKIDQLSPGVRLVHVSGAGHDVHKDQPKIFVQTCLEGVQPGEGRKILRG